MKEPDINQPAEPDPGAATPSDPTLALIEFVEGVGRLVEKAAGYREKCGAAGFSPTAAEAMAVELHSHLLAQAFSKAKR